MHSAVRVRARQLVAAVRAEVLRCLVSHLPDDVCQEVMKRTAELVRGTFKVRAQVQDDIWNQLLRQISTMPDVARPLHTAAWHFVQAIGVTDFRSHASGESNLNVLDVGAQYLHRVTEELNAECSK